jgi:hypothetical protein
MLAAALALACTAAPVASGHQFGGSGGGPIVATSVSPTPYSLGLPGGTLNATGAQQTALVQHRLGEGVSSPTTPYSLGLPGGTLNATGAQQTALVQHRSGEGVSSPTTPYSLGLPGGTLNATGTQQTARFQGRSDQGVSARRFTFGLGGVELSRWEAQRIAVRGHQSEDAIGWLIVIGAVALVVIGTAFATRRQRVGKHGSSQTVQTA